MKEKKKKLNKRRRKKFYAYKAKELKALDTHNLINKSNVIIHFSLPFACKTFVNV